MAAVCRLHQKGLIYKGYTIQPYSPKAGTGLSSHELNQPGAYRDVTDTTVVAQFRLFPRMPPGAPMGRRMQESLPVDLLALDDDALDPAVQHALTIGANIDYNVVRTANRIHRRGGRRHLAQALSASISAAKKAPESEVLATVKGVDLVGFATSNSFRWAQPMERPETHSRSSLAIS